MCLQWASDSGTYFSNTLANRPSNLHSHAAKGTDMVKLALRLAMVVVVPLSVTIGSGVVQASNDGDEIKLTPPNPGYAEFEDMDAASYPDANAQSVFLVAPAAIPNSPLATLFENNVQTNSATFYLLQNGLQFRYGAGSVIWTDTTQSYANQLYDPIIPYVASHVYSFSITFTSGSWQMCAEDTNDPSTYRCRSEPAATGTVLQAGINTAVWVETHSKTANWYYGFSSPLQAYAAEIYRNGVGQFWSTQQRHTMDACSSSWPTANAISGSMVQGGVGNFTLSGVPWACPVFTTNLPDIGNSGSWSTYTFVRNNTSSSGHVTITYYDTAGNPVATRGDLSINANGMVIDTPPSNFTGAAAVGADLDASVVTARAQTGPYVVDGYAGITTPATTVLAPLVHRNNGGWYSDLIIMNAGSSNTDVSVAFQQLGISGDICSQILASIPPAGSVTLSTANSCIPGSSAFVGSVRISSQSSQPLAVVATQRKDYNSDGRVDSLAEYGGLPSGSASVTNYYPLLMQGNSNWGAGITLQNNDPANSSTGTVFLFSGTGGACGSGGYTILARSLAVIFPLPLSGCSTPYVGNGRASFGRPVAGVVNFIHSPASDYSDMSENAVVAPTTAAVIPLAIRNATFFGRGGWYTGLNVQNASTATAHPNIYYYGSSGNLLVHQVLTVSPNGSATVFPLPSAVGDNFIGSAWVTSDQPIAVSVTHQPAFAAGEDDAFAYAAANR